VVLYDGIKHFFQSKVDVLLLVQLMLSMIDQKRRFCYL